VDIRSFQLILCLSFNAEKTLDDYVVDLGPHMGTVYAQLFHVRTKGRHAPFEATITLLRIIVLHECLVLLVDRVVSQMRELGLLRRQVLILILFRGEAHESLPIYVDAQWIVASDNDV